MKKKKRVKRYSKERATNKGSGGRFKWSLFKRARMHLQIKCSNTGQFPQLCDCEDEYQGRFTEALSAQLSGMRGKKNVESH